jgi:hypothetical protein
MLCIDAEFTEWTGGYINHFYNRQRTHSEIGYHSSARYERVAAQ